MDEKHKEIIVGSAQGQTGTGESSTLKRLEDKGKAPVVEREELNLMDIKPSDLDKPIEVRVYRKWTSRNVPDPNPTGLCFILLDRQVSFYK